MSEHSKACCETPVPDAIAQYWGTGEWIEIDGRKTYITGDKTATRAVLYIFDIFGFSPQTLRGADILAEALSASKPSLVIVPDWFDGSVAEKAWVPPVTPEQQAKLSNFIQNKAAPELVVPHVLKLSKVINQTFTNVAKLGLFGFCWGGKLASLACLEQNDRFTVAVQTSPARMDPEEAKGVSVPMALLLSGDDDADLASKYVENLRKDSLMERFETQIHGWMSARGNLNDAKVRAEYERGYKVAGEFLLKHL